MYEWWGTFTCSHYHHHLKPIVEERTERVYKTKITLYIVLLCVNFITF